MPMASTEYLFLDINDDERPKVFSLILIQGRNISYFSQKKNIKKPANDHGGYVDNIIAATKKTRTQLAHWA